MPNQRTSSAKRVPKGTAPLLFSPQTKKLRTKKMVKMMPTKRQEVSRMFFFHSVPLSVLCRKAEEKPAGTPMNTKSSSIAVIRPPRLAGERNPSTANAMVMTDIVRVCTPVPTLTESSIGIGGGRKLRGDTRARESRGEGRGGEESQESRRRRSAPRSHPVREGSTLGR